MSKRKILFNTNSSVIRTGFGRAANCLLKYLYNTNKYEIFHICAGMAADDPNLNRTPWVSLPAFKSHQEVHQIQDDRLRQLTVYGAMAIDEVIKREKIFAAFFIEDFWAFNCFNSPWFNKVHSIIWTTLDSEPLLPQALIEAPKIKNYWTWADFASKALNKAGFEQAKTVYGPIDSTPFYRLSDKEKLNLKNNLNIPQDSFIAGFFFRNQLRKLVPNTLEGWKIFKEQNNIKNAYLLFHTHFGEGWDIPRLIQEYGISPNEVLVTHVCKSCKKYTVQSFMGQEKKCPYCGDEKGLVTTSPNLGVSEKQLNEIYNLCSVYLQIMTSGGLEYPLIEAKLCELITITVPYSCGETFTVPEAQSLALDYAEYREIGTQFIKASPYPSSIAKNLNKVYNMKSEKKREMEQKARQWALERFDIKVIGKYIENFIDSLPDIDYDYQWDYVPRNPNFPMPQIQDDIEWLKILYKNILLIEEPGSGLEYWISEIKKGVKREDIYKFFIQTAINENQKNQKVEFSDLLIKNNKKNLAVIQPGSIGDLIGLQGTFESLRSRYPFESWNFYMITEPRYFEVFEDNEYIDKLLPYQPWMDTNFLMEGIGTNKGYFDISYCPFRRPQRTADYIHNGKDLIDLQLK